MRSVLGCVLSFLVSVLAAGQASQAPSSTLQAIQAQAEKFKAVVAVPTFETTTADVQATVTSTIAAGNLALDKIANVPTRGVGFDNTVRALDHVLFEAATASYRLSMLAQLSPDAPLRAAATAATKSLQDWIVGIDYREDVYRSIKLVADTAPKLTGEDEKLLSDTLRTYRRAGLDLPKAERARVEQWRKELAALSTDFEANATQAAKSVKFTRADVDGVSADFLEQIKRGDDELHTRIDEGNASETVPISNAVARDAFLPFPDDTAFLGYFSHIVSGYDAGYSGYAWADAISADMATVFEKAPGGFFDTDTGMRFRREILEPGDSRDVNVSLERFLGRPRSLEPLLRQLGIGPRP